MIRKILLILPAILSISLCYSQTMNFNGIEFDISRLDMSRQYSTMNYDTVGVSENSQGTVVSYSMKVHASKNNKYFLLCLDTLYIAPLGMFTGCDVPAFTSLYFYEGEKLLWSERRENSIGRVYFFEDRGSVIISWVDAFADNYRLFYNNAGQVIDTIPVKGTIYDLDNHKKLLVSHHRELYNRVELLNSLGDVVWKDEFLFEKGIWRRVQVSGTGNRYCYEYNDSLIFYNSDHELIFRIGNPDNKYSGFLSHSGRFYFKGITTEMSGNRVLNSHVLVYDLDNNHTGKIDSVTYDHFTSQVCYPYLVEFSDFIYFLDYITEKKFNILITDYQGRPVVSFTSEDRGSPVVKKTRTGFELVQNSKLIKSFEYPLDDGTDKSPL